MTQDTQTNYSDTVIFIGNGFDIACGCKTSYAHFINSSRGKELRYSKNMIFNHILDIYKEANWVDIEVEIGNFANIWASKDGKNIIEFEDAYQELARCLSTYIYFATDSNIPYSVEMSNFIEDEGWFNSPACVINFNYTDVCSRMLVKWKDKVDMKNIHGLIPRYSSQNFSSIVLGVDETFELKNGSYKFIIKSRQDQCKMAGLNKRIKSASKYIFYGTSLGVTDQLFLSKVFSQEQEGKEFIIYAPKGEDGRIYNRIENLADWTISEFKQNNSLEIRPAFQKEQFYKLPPI